MENESMMGIVVLGLIVAFVVIIPIVFFIGFSGLVAVSIDPKVNPDLGFFSLLLKQLHQKATNCLYLSMFALIW